MNGVRYRVTWRDPWDRDGQHLVGDGMDVDAFVEGLAAGTARDICVYPMAPEPEPWTFGDLDVGDWFVDPRDGLAWQRVREYVEGTAPRANARCLDGRWGRFFDETAVDPFEWEWSE